MSAGEWHSKLVDVLIGPDLSTLRLYHTNPEFRAGVESIARLVPVVVEALANKAEEAGQRREELFALLEAAPLLPASIDHLIYPSTEEGEQ